MGKRAHLPPADLQNYVTSPLKKIRSIRKRKVAYGNSETPVRPAKASRLTGNEDTEDEDEDSSSNDATVHNCSTKQANNSSILLNSSLKIHGVEQTSLATNESPRPVYSLRPSVVNGTILYDLKQKPWRLGSPIGKGNFGEIFLASDNITVPVTNENAKFVVKIEPHSNGPLFVEIHCILNTAKKQQTSIKGVKMENEALSKPCNNAPSGIPDYIASGSHYFGDARYRFLVLQRFDQDLHSLIKNSCVSQKCVLTLAIQIINVLENLHDKGYCHNDVKSQNLMISKCKYYKNKFATDEKQTTIKSKFDENYDEKQPTTDSGNSSEQEANDDDDDYDYEVEFGNKRKSNYNNDIDDDEDFDDGTTTSNSNSNSMDIYKTPVSKNNKGRRAGNRSVVQYSGSNPVRSCRRQQRPNSIYEEMVNSHYLRPSKRISYSEFFADDGTSVKGDVERESRDTNFNSTEDDDSIGFVPNSVRRRNRNSSNKKSNNVQRSSKSSPCKRLTRRQEKLLLEKQQKQKPTILNQYESVGKAIHPTVQMVPVEAEHIFLIDFGLASKYIDNGVHRPFVMDQRRAHDGTLEFTSRDAHMGAHSRRSDLECLGYNLIFWSQGFLPWKEAAAQQQQEKVHRAKEYLMTDVREMLKQIYGKDVPKYLGEFLHLVGQLAYHERPQYERYRRLFEREFIQLGYSIEKMCLDSQEISRTCVRIKKDYGIEKHDFFDLNNKLVNNNVLSIMKSGGTPFQERGSLGDRVSPKNLRSKSDKKTSRKKKFCWAEVLSQDPDQIARERAEKEFDREINDEEDRPVRRYDGKPTYAILELFKKYGERNDNEDDKNMTDVKEEYFDDAEHDEQEEDEEEEEEEENSEKEEEETDSSDAIEDEEEENYNEENDDDLGEEEMENSSSDEDSCDEEDIDTEASESSIAPKINRGRSNRFKKKKKQLKNVLRGSEKKVQIVNSRGNRKTSATFLTKDLNTTKKNKRSSRKNVKTSSSATESVKFSEETPRRRFIGRRNCRNISHRQTAAASAAGEVEQQLITQYLFENGQNGRQKRCQQSHSRVVEKERSKRRCPIKTDATEMLNGGNGRLLGVQDDSNSNFSPDVRILFKVWKKMSNENIYTKSAAAAASKVASGGGMITRHYRK